MSPHPPTPGPERGFVLLIVLWTMALLGLIGAQLAAHARGEASVAANTSSVAQLEAAADGGVNAAIFRLLSREWAADAQPRTTRAGPVALTTTIVNEAGRINPNNSPMVLVQSLLHVLGLDTRSADDIAMAMLLWRTRPETVRPQYQQAGRRYAPSGLPFQSLDELGLVLGVTPDLLARLKPHLSLFHEGDVDRTFADPVVAQALEETGSAATPLRALGLRSDEMLVRVTVAARSSGDRQFVRTAEIRFTPQTPTAAGGYAILSWENDWFGKNEDP